MLPLARGRYLIGCGLTALLIAMISFFIRNRISVVLERHFTIQEYVEDPSSLIVHESLHAMEAQIEAREKSIRLRYSFIDFLEVNGYIATGFGIAALLSVVWALLLGH